MKLFLDMSPAFDPLDTPERCVSYGLAAGALASEPSEDVYFCVGDALLPRAFIAWALSSDWSAGAPLRKLSEGAVQRAELGRALVKHAGESHVFVAVGDTAPSAARSDGVWDAVVRVLGRAATVEQAQAADLVCYLSKAAWRGHPPSGLSTTPVTVTPAAPGAWGAIDDAVYAQSDAPSGRGLVILPDGASPAEREVVWSALRARGDQAPPIEATLITDDLAPATRPADLERMVSATPRSSDVALRRQLDGAAVVVAPRLFDPMGRWAREANLLGAPVIAPVGGGAAEFGDPETTLHYDPASATSFAAALNRRWANPLTPIDRAALAERTRRYDWPQAGARILQAARSWAAFQST